MNPYLYPFISPIVRQTCKEHKLPYADYGSFASAWWAMITYLYALGHPENLTAANAASARLAKAKSA